MTNPLIMKNSSTPSQPYDATWNSGANSTRDGPCQLLRSPAEKWKTTTYAAARNRMPSSTSRRYLVRGVASFGRTLGRIALLWSVALPDTKAPIATRPPDRPNGTYPEHGPVQPRVAPSRTRRAPHRRRDLTTVGAIDAYGRSVVASVGPAAARAIQRDYGMARTDAGDLRS